MDYIVLSCTCRICGYAASYPRRLLSATLGALWAIVVEVSRGALRNVFHVCTYVIISTVMVMIISGTTRIKKISKGLAVLYVVTFGICGAVYMFNMYTSCGMLITVKIMSDPELLMYVVLTLVILKLLYLKMSKLKSIKSYMYKVEICVKDVRFTVDGLMDTGNHLTDPYNGMPVSVIDKRAVPSDINIGATEKIHYIPISSVGCSSGVIMVFTASACHIYNSSMDITLNNVLIGISETALSKGENYDLLINPILIENGEDRYGIKSSSGR